MEGQALERRGQRKPGDEEGTEVRGREQRERPDSRCCRARATSRGHLRVREGDGRQDLQPREESRGLPISLRVCSNSYQCSGFSFRLLFFNSALDVLMSATHGWVRTSALSPYPVQQTKRICTVRMRPYLSVYLPSLLLPLSFLLPPSITPLLLLLVLPSLFSLLPSPFLSFHLFLSFPSPLFIFLFLFLFSFSISLFLSLFLFSGAQKLVFVLICITVSYNIF